MFADSDFCKTYKGLELVNNINKLTKSPKELLINDVFMSELEHKYSLISGRINCSKNILYLNRYFPYIVAWTIYGKKEPKRNPSFNEEEAKGYILKNVVGKTLARYCYLLDETPLEKIQVNYVTADFSIVYALHITKDICQN